MKTVNMLGDTQREQWHSVVHILRAVGQRMEPKAYREVLDEIDRYIDASEDLRDEVRDMGLAEEDDCDEGEAFYVEQQRLAYEHAREDLEV